MNILFINGSPKGNYSITLQTALFIQKKFPEHKYSFLNVGNIRSLEKDFSNAEALLYNAEIIIFCYPVYTFLTPYQLHRFIELLFENNINLNGKTVSQITTSKHFYDITAHNFIKDNCCDLNMNYINGLSADMDDLTKEKGQSQACQYFNYLLWSHNNSIFNNSFSNYNKNNVIFNDTIPYNEKTSKNDIVIVTDANEKTVSLNNMIKQFQNAANFNTRILNINDIKIKGGCLGCLNCAATGECVYKDDFCNVLRNDIQRSDAIVYAFSIKNHSMGSKFKMYDDRQFCNGHRSVTRDRPVAYIVSGNISKEENLRLVINAKCEVEGNFLAGIICDENDTSNEIISTCQKLNYAIENKLSLPSNFLGVGGMKIFRDLVFQMRGMMKEDHKFYKQHNLYDFPHNHKLISYAMYAVGFALSNKKIRSKMGNKMNEGMLMPYKKIIDKN